MPTAPPSRCNEAGCSVLTTQGRCDEHTRKPWAGRQDKAKRYGMSSGTWRKLKRRVTSRDNGCCYRCGADQDDAMRDDPESTGFVMDHITPISEGGSARDMDNLGLLCGPCDEAKSKDEAARGSARHRARSGASTGTFERLWLDELLPSAQPGRSPSSSPPGGRGVRISSLIAWGPAAVNSAHTRSEL